MDSKRASGTSFGADGKRYTAAGGAKQILRYDENGKESIVADSIAGNDLVVAHNGNIYVTVPDGTSPRGKVYLIRKNGEKMMVEDGLKFPNGVTLSPDQTQLYVTESASHWVWIYRVMPDGTLAYKQRYGWLHVPDTEENAWPDGLKCDTAGRVYVATRIGIQIMDQLGRVNAIISIPSIQRTDLIQEMVSPQIDNDCWKCTCWNPINSFKQNGKQVIPTQGDRNVFGYSYPAYIRK